MPRDYRTVQGDMLDLICRRHYGRHTDMTEMVLEANYRLSEYPLILPAGLTIILPDDPQPEPVRMQKLW